MFPNSLLSRLRIKVILSMIITFILTYRLFVEGSVREQWEVIFRKMDSDGFSTWEKVPFSVRQIERLVLKTTLFISLLKSYFCSILVKI